MVLSLLSLLEKIFAKNFKANLGEERQRCRGPSEVSEDVSLRRCKSRRNLRRSVPNGQSEKQVERPRLRREHKGLKGKSHLGGSAEDLRPTGVKLSGAEDV